MKTIKGIRVFISLLVCLAMIMSVGPKLQVQAATEQYSGNLGDSVTWKLDASTGTLTISGSGSIPDYHPSLSPFCKDSRIKKIVIEEGIETVGYNSFTSCTELKSVSLPSTVQKIGSNAFGGAVKLTEINLPEGVVLSEAALRETGLTEISLPKGTRLGGMDIFDGCRYLKKVELPEDLTAIPSGAFKGCTSLITITIPQSVEMIDFAAFSGCTRLVSAFIPSTTTVIGSGVFNNCNAVFTIVSKKGSAAEAYAKENGLKFAEIGEYTEQDGEQQDITWVWDEETATLTISGKGDMTAVDWTMEAATWNATTVVIEKGITSIADNAFSNHYSKLTNVKIANTVKKIGASAFMNCSNLTKIDLPNSVKEIGNKAFQGAGLKSIEIPDGVTTIKQFTFAVCNDLEIITIPNTVTEIEMAAFSTPFVSGYKLKNVVVHGEPKSLSDFVVGPANEVFEKATFSNEPHNRKEIYCRDYVVTDVDPFAENFEPDMIEEAVIYSDSTVEPESLDCQFFHKSGKSYWYEDGVRQGTVDDPKGVVGDGTVRGREIFDPDTNGWYWCDSIYEGAKAINKEVWMPYIYQDETTWDDAMIEQISMLSENMASQIAQDIKAGKGKWVRYNANGKMFKGWYKVTKSEAKYYPDQAGNIYYYDLQTGLMAKGWLNIDGKDYHFDEITGVLIN